jgi:pimeloyl-ACP methyl ester carboxylesterase
MSPSVPPPPFHVQASIGNPSLFLHHKSLSALWENKWRKPASMAAQGVYPFVDGKFEDFQQIFETLVAENNNDYNVVLDPDKYAVPFFPFAEALVSQAISAEEAGKTEEARDLYLRAAAVYRIARFPINRSPLSQKAWEDGKAAYMAGSKYLSPPNTEVLIPHKHASAEAGETVGANIPVYLRIPTGEKPVNGWPVLLYICGLDGYRTDYTGRITEHIRHGFACLVVDIPGTGDCPSARNDPTSPDRLWSSVLDWIDDQKSQYHFDTTRIIARGMSTGGYYAIRIAHTHADRLYAVVAQGAGSHYMFEPEWIRAQNHMEYPFALADALAFKFGYKSVEEYIADNPKAKFSLLENGILDSPKCARLMLINGMEDSIFPIEDSILALRRGSVKEARFLDDRQHVGNPGAEDIVYEWIDSTMRGAR